MFDMHRTTPFIKLRGVVSRNIKMKGCKDVGVGAGILFLLSSFRMGKERGKEQKKSKHWVSAQGKKHTGRPLILVASPPKPSPFPLLGIQNPNFSSYPAMAVHLLYLMCGYAVG